MLRRKLAGSASFVCLQCRLQLAGTPPRPLLAAVALPSLRTSRRPLGTYTGRTGADEHNGKTNNKADTETSPETFAESNDAIAGHNHTGASYRILHGPPPSQHRTYKSRGHFLAPEQEGLSIDILGKPGSAIVLREKRAIRKRHRADSDDSQHQVDPTSLLPNEDAAATSEDVLLNIHELKPEGTRILSNRKFKALKDTLVEGFTSTQLGHYIREHQETQRFRQDVEGSSDVAPWVLARQPWAPVVENSAEDLDSHLVGYITKRMPPKERLAVRLMRECWDVSNQKVLDQDGYLSITLRDVEFSLLTLGSRRWLEGTQRAILALVKQVKLIRESRLVSVVAPKHAAELILERINRVLSNARTSDFAADLVSPKPMELSVLEEVGRMTNTVTRLDRSGKKVLVTWIHMPERDDNFENAGETVLRFLRDAYGPKPRVSGALEIVPGDLAHRGRYIPALDCSQKLPWQERFEKWERWTAAVPQWSDDPATQQALVPASILPFHISPEEAVHESESSIDNAPSWTPELQTETSAIFGQVVFARQEQASSLPTPTIQPATELNTSLPRTFVPTLPALGSLNLPSNLHEGGLWHTIVVVRFAPSPDISPELAASAPNLELRIDADHKEIKSLTSLRAVQETFTGDVLFPAAAVDARLTQQRFFTLPGPSIEHHVPSILTFLSKSDLRPWDGKLNTPPVLLGVQLPRRLLSPTATTTTTTSTPASAADADPVQVDYTLASIEVQRTVTAEYQSLKLRYTSIQAGQRGGTRSELSLDAVRVASQDDAAAAKIAVGDDAAYPSPPDASDAYEIVDEADIRAQLGSHSANQSNTAAAETLKPVDLEEFILAASGIVNEHGRLKWHAKRS